MQAAHKGVIFRFRVADDDVVVGNEKSVCDFPLRRKALATSGGAEDQPVGVFQPLAVTEDHIA